MNRIRVVFSILLIIAGIILGGFVMKASKQIVKQQEARLNSILEATK